MSTWHLMLSGMIHNRGAQGERTKIWASSEQQESRVGVRGDVGSGSCAMRKSEGVESSHLAWKRACGDPKERHKCYGYDYYCVHVPTDLTLQDRGEVCTLHRVPTKQRECSPSFPPYISSSRMTWEIPPRAETLLKASLYLVASGTALGT